jgi:hypothetical protein
MTDDTALSAALQAVYHLIEEGRPPNGIVSTDCGPYADLVQELHETYQMSLETQELIKANDPHGAALERARALWAMHVEMNIPIDAPLIEAMRRAVQPSRRRLGLLQILEALHTTDDKKRLALDLADDASALPPAEMLRLKDALKETFGLPPGWIREWVSAVKDTAKARKEQVRALIPAPTPTDAPDDQKATWPYLVVDGRMLFCAQKADLFGGASVAHMPIADFAAQITEEQIGEDGRKLFLVEGATIGGRPFQITIEAEDFADDRRLKAVLTAAAGAQAPIYVGMAKHLGTAIQRLSGEIASVRRFTRTGWADDVFLLPGRDIPNTTIILGRKLPYGLSNNAQLDLGLQALDALLLSHGPECGGVVLSFLLTPPLALAAGWRNERYGAFIAGRTGSLKSSMSQAMMCLYGHGFIRDDLLVKWGQGATNNALMAMAVAAYDLPFLIDNYKPNTGDGPKAFVNLIHNIVEGGEKDRLNRASELRDSRPVFAWPLVTGEDVPDKDPASLARVLVVTFARPADLSYLTQAQRLSAHLCAIGRSWIEWIEGDGKAIIIEAAARFETVRNDWTTFLVEARPDIQNALRIASNLATNELTWAIAEQHPAIGALVRTHADAYFAGLQATARRMADYTAESMEAQRFIEMLRDMLTTEQAVLINRGTMPGLDSQRMVGWKAEDGGAYLLMPMARALIERYFGKDVLNTISEKTLYSQLQDLGFIVPGRDRATMQLWEGNKNQRVVRLTPLALGADDSAS